MDIEQIMRDVQADFGMGGLVEGITSDFAREVGNRAAEAEREACARVCERQAEERFHEYGTREPDTGATYYSGRAAEEYEARDEEDEACAAAIRARSEEWAAYSAKYF